MVCFFYKWKMKISWALWWFSMNLCMVCRRFYEWNLDFRTASSKKEGTDGHFLFLENQKGCFTLGLAKMPTSLQPIYWPFLLDRHRKCKSKDQMFRCAPLFHPLIFKSNKTLLITYWTASSFAITSWTMLNKPNQLVWVVQLVRAQVYMRACECMCVFRF